MAMTKKEKESTVAHMLGVMFADGKIATEEMKLLKGVCGKLGFRTGEVMAAYVSLLKNPKKSFFKVRTDINATPAKDSDGRTNQLLSAVMMMATDGVLGDEEVEFCKGYARALGFPTEIVPDMMNSMIEVVTESIEQGLDQNHIYERILSQRGFFD